MTPLLESLSRRLSELGGRGRGRALTAPSGVDFTSNDYLGFSRHPRMRAAVEAALERGVPVGSGGSRLLRGNHPEHEALEAEAAAFFGAESALYFNSGFDANLAIFSTLPTRHDAVVHDALIHASVKEGIRAGFAKPYAAAHNDVQAFEDAVVRARAAGAREVFLAVESLYSMEGDRAPLADLMELARRREAVLVVDEAHAVGVFGARGRGFTEGLADERLLALFPCGKALGGSGALLAAPAAVKDALISGARPFLFSTAASPLLAAALRESLRLVDAEPERRKRLLFLSCRARRAAKKALSRWTLLGARSQILPVVVGGDAQTLAAAEYVRARGFDVRAIRPPTVPEGSARLRIAVSVDRTETELSALLDALKEAERRG